MVYNYLRREAQCWGDPVNEFVVKHINEDDSAELREENRRLKAENEKLRNLVSAYRSGSKEHRLYLRLVDEFDRRTDNSQKLTLWTP